MAALSLECDGSALDDVGDLMSTEASHCNEFMHISPLNAQRFSRGQELKFLAQCPPLPLGKARDTLPGFATPC